VICARGTNTSSSCLQVARVQPKRAIKTPRQTMRGDANVPVFIIICMLACGKIVAVPGVSTCVTSRAPFSSYMYVVVLPCTATT
jgi:hypothetical protein